MAIEAYKRRRWQFTKVSIAEILIAIIIFLISLLILWSGVKKWLYKYYYKNALYYYDSNQLQKITESLNSAINWNSESPYPKVFLAKVAANTGDLAKAEELYNKLIDNYDVQDVANVGLGVVYLKRADQEKDNLLKIKLIEKAKGYFLKASKINSDCIETVIGFANATLLEGLESGDLEPAKNAFNKINISKSFATKDGLIDYYTGLGKLYSLDKVSTYTSARNFRIAYQYLPKKGTALIANVINIEAKRYGVGTLTLDDLKKQKTYIDRLFNEAFGLWRSGGQEYAELETPCLNLICALIWAFGVQGDNTTAQNYLMNAKTNFFINCVEPLLTEAQLNLEWSKGRKPNESIGYKRNAKAIFDRIKQANLLSIHESLRNRIKAVIHNNLAVITEYESLFAGGKGGVGLADINEALKIEPENYTINRNKAVILKKMGNDKDAEDCYKKVLDIAGKPDFAKDERLVRDLENLKKFFGK